MEVRYRVVARRIPGNIFRKEQNVVIVQKYVEVKSFANGWISRSYQWVDCNADDAQDVILELFCKGEK